MLSERVKQIGIGVVACLALAMTILFAAQAVRAVQHFQHSRQFALSGDVRGIRSWMTIPYIARVYRVPESYLLQSLHIADPNSVRRVTLQTLAGRLHTTPDTLIHDIQIAILTYRKSHPTSTPSGTPPVNGLRLASGKQPT